MVSTLEALQSQGRTTIANRVDFEITLTRLVQGSQRPSLIQALSCRMYLKSSEEAYNPSLPISTQVKKS